jgi:thiamine kinase-like enzyme
MDAAHAGPLSYFGILKGSYWCRAERSPPVIEMELLTPILNPAKKNHFQKDMQLLDNKSVVERISGQTLTDLDFATLLRNLILEKEESFSVFERLIALNMYKIANDIYKKNHKNPGKCSPHNDMKPNNFVYSDNGDVFIIDPLMRSDID